MRVLTVLLTLLAVWGATTFTDKATEQEAEVLTLPTTHVRVDSAYREAAEIRRLSRMLENQGVDSEKAERWALYFDRYGTEAGVDPLTLMAMAYHESEFNPRAYNPSDPSYGLMQVMPTHWRNDFVRQCGVEATPRTLMVPRVNICYGAYIAGYFASQHPASERRGITAYNNGSGRLNGYAKEVYRRKQQLSG